LMMTRFFDTLDFTNPYRLPQHNQNSAVPADDDGKAEDDCKASISNSTVIVHGIWSACYAPKKRRMVHKVDDANDEAIENIVALDAFNTEFNSEVADTLKQLWEDPNIQEAFSHKDETAVPDHMDYFFEKIDDLADSDYVPTDEDVLRARIRSIGVEAITFDIDGACTTFYDVGGQKNERSKWDNVTDKVSGVVFCVSFAEYDKPMFEDPDTLRIHDALEIFKDLTHRTQFAQSPFFLVANKIDIFNKKITETDSFVKVFPDFTGDCHNPDECANFLIQKFIEAAAPQMDDRPIETFKITALNADQVVETTAKICKYISDKFFE